MILSEIRTRELREAAKPLIKWLANNCHPHCRALVDEGSVELEESVTRQVCDEFIQD